MTDRLPCKSPGCTHDILPSTAAETGGFCMPCVQAKAREEHQAYVRANRREVNPFEGVTDPVEIIKLHHVERESDELVTFLPFARPLHEVYGSLSPAQREALASHVLDLSRRDRDAGERILLELAAFTDTNLGPIQRWLADGYKIYPPLAFRGAPAEVRERLFKLAEDYPDSRNHALLALAWIGDERVVERFAAWRRTPPSWRQDVFIPPEMYAREAGWELTRDGRRRDLYSTSCRPLVAGTGDPIRIGHRLKERCPWCDQALTELIEGTVTCHTCTGFGFVHMASGRWHPWNQKPGCLPPKGDEWETIPIDPLRLSLEPRPARCSASWFLPLTFSQVGGLPTWVQDAEYPACLGCGETMGFIAQLDNTDMHEFGEGIYYTFACDACRTTATSYQQS